MLPFEEESAVKEPDIPLPEGKMSFKPEELYRFTKIKPFVLRFWESEFPALKPKKSEPDGLAYSRADVEMILAIKQLLYDEGLTLAEARQRLSGEEDGAQEATGKNATRKKKKISGKKKAVAAGPVQTAAKVRQGKAPAKRGLPATPANRSRVSLEELLPGNAAASGVAAEAVKGKVKRTEGKKKKTPAAVPPAADTEIGVPELRRKLSDVLRELREILTFLHKGDR
jgi:DNA-binding transcriptional MerR regulator